VASCARSRLTDVVLSLPARLENIINTPKHHIGPMSGNIVESFTVNDDVTKYTVHHAEGHEMVDGEPLTTDDAVLLGGLFAKRAGHGGSRVRNSGTGPSQRGPDGRSRIVDDFSFNVTFKKPTGRFLNEIGMATCGIRTTS